MLDRFVFAFEGDVRLLFRKCEVGDLKCDVGVLAMS